MGVLSQTAGADTGAIQVNVFGTSDMGRVRKNNEDNFVVCNLTTGEVGLGASLRRHVLGLPVTESRLFKPRNRRPVGAI